jgi:hypothetical protein
MSNQCTLEVTVAELASQVIADVTAAVAAGAPTVHCQLLASRLYDALRRQLRNTADRQDDARRQLRAAIDRCERTAGASISPGRLLAELEIAAQLLAPREPPAPLKGRPQLRVIQGGLA